MKAAEKHIEGDLWSLIEFKYLKGLSGITQHALAFLSFIKLFWKT